MKKNKIMITIIIIFVILIMGVAIYLYCDKIMPKKTIKSVDGTITIGTKTYIKQLEEIKINGTDDYFIITEKRSFKSDEDEDIPKGALISWEISIPYRIHVRGTDYEGFCTLGDNEGCNDNNPDYKIKLTNLNEENNIPYAEVLIKKKHII